MPDHPLDRPPDAPPDVSSDATPDAADTTFDDDPNRGRVHKGRGATSNRSGRFEAEVRVAFDDGWSADDDEPPAIETQVSPVAVRRIITGNDSPDIPFERSINPYQGCEHGCVYCFARPTHAYWGMSPGLDFESRLLYKPDAARALEAELRRPAYECRTIALGANTDPYQPIERRLEVTRRLLEVMRAFRHPVAVVTKSNLVVRDADILGELAADGLASAMVSITTLDRRLARRMEPRAPTPARRLDAIRALADAGVPVGVLASPMIPALNDAELEQILAAAADAGARTAGYILVRLPREVADLFAEWLEAHYPDRARRVLGMIRDTRGGALYDATYGTRMRGTGPYADLLARRFDVAARRLGLFRGGPALDTSKFAPPPRAGDQLRLL